MFSFNNVLSHFVDPSLIHSWNSSSVTLTPIARPLFVNSLAGLGIRVAPIGPKQSLTNCT